MGSLKTNLGASVVEADIPLLIGAPDMKWLGLTVNFGKDKMFISETGETIEISTNENNHLIIPLTTSPLHKETHEIMSIADCDMKEKKKKIKRVHHVLDHPCEDILKTSSKIVLKLTKIQ